MANEFLNHTLESLETLLYQTKQHILVCREQGRDEDLPDLNRAHAAIEKAISEIHMTMAGLR